MSRFGPLGNPTLLAFIVAGGITAGLAYMVLAAGSSLIPDRPDPVGTAIAAPTEQAMVTVEPTQPPSQSLTPTPGIGNEQALVTDEDEAGPENTTPPTAVPTRPAVTPSPAPNPTRTGPTPTPRVVNVVPPTQSPGQAPTEVPTQAPLTLPTEAATEAAEITAPTQAPPPAVASDSTNTQEVIAAPTSGVEIIQLPPVDQAPQQVAQAPAPTEVPIVSQPVADAPIDAGTTSGNGAPQNDGNAPGGATTLLFPTAIAAVPEGSGNANGPGNAPTANGNILPGNSGNPAGTSNANNPGTGSAPAVIDEPTQVADQPVSGREIADSVISRNRERTDDLRECIEDRAQGRNRDRGRNRNRDRDNQGENRGQNQGRNDDASCGDLVTNPNGNPGNGSTGDLGQEIRDDVRDQLKAAGIDPDD